MSLVHIRFATEEAYRDFYKEVEDLYKQRRHDIDDPTLYIGLSESRKLKVRDEIERTNKLIWDDCEYEVSCRRENEVTPRPKRRRGWKIVEYLLKKFRR